MLMLVADFSALTACEGESIQLRCPRAQFIAIRSVVFGWSNTFHLQSKCARGRLPTAADHGMLCPRGGGAGQAGLKSEYQLGGSQCSCLRRQLAQCIF